MQHRLKLSDKMPQILKINKNLYPFYYFLYKYVRELKRNVFKNFLLLNIYVYKNGRKKSKKRHIEVSFITNANGNKISVIKLTQHVNSIFISCSYSCYSSSSSSSCCCCSCTNSGTGSSTVSAFSCVSCWEFWHLCIRQMLS